MTQGIWRAGILAGALAFVTPMQVSAVTLVSDGSAVTRNSSADGTDAIQLDNGSNAVINTGGSAVNSGSQPGGAGIFARQLSDVQVAGGTVQGRATLSGGDGVEMRGGVFDFTSGSITGGVGSAFGGGDGIQMSDAGELSITGGSATGGNGVRDGGFGVGIYGTSTGAITGGTISGGFDANGVRNYSIRTSETAELVLRGGIFNGDFLVEGRSTLTIFGTNLDFQRNSRRLTGTLQNGTALDLLLFKAPDAFLNLIQAPTMSTVPLPASAVLLIAGMASFGAVRKSKRRAA